jgi:hypothetical protein
MKYLLIVMGIITGIMGSVIAFLTLDDSSQHHVEVSGKVTEKEEEKKGWYEVGVFAGTEYENTESFVINEDATKWKIAYSLNDVDYLPTFSINVYDKKTKEQVVFGMTSNGLSQLIAEEGTKEVIIEDIRAGEYYLEVSSLHMGSWDIVVEELY